MTKAWIGRRKFGAIQLQSMQSKIQLCRPGCAEFLGKQNPPECNHTIYNVSIQRWYNRVKLCGITGLFKTGVHARIILNQPPGLNTTYQTWKMAKCQQANLVISGLRIFGRGNGEQPNRVETFGAKRRKESNGYLDQMGA